MHKLISCALFITIINAQDCAKLLRMDDGKIYYTANYFMNNESYFIQFDADNPSTGHISELSTSASAEIKDNVVTLGTLSYFYDSCQFFRITEPSELSYLLDIYKIVQKDFKARQNNNTLPQIQYYK